MLRYKRPSEPAQFATAVAPLKSIIAKRIDVLIRKAAKQAAKDKQRKTPRKKVGRSKKSTLNFVDVWKQYKDVFSYTQFGKCGFCESAVTKTGYGDVEHYHPKSEVWELSDLGGRRSKTVLSEFGYWWLAYDWTNYLFACAKCNQKYKGSYFPIREKMRRLPPNERPTKKFPRETPLLLSPYGRRDPGKHLQLEITGVVRGRNRSLFGHETIRTCNLNRVELGGAREEKALRALELIQRLAQRNNTRNPTVLSEIYALGRDSAEHAGMVREIFKDYGLNWQTLVRRCVEEMCRQLKTARAANTTALEVQLEPMGRERYKCWKVVREVYEKSSKTRWNSLVLKRSEQLARDLLAAQKQLDTTVINIVEKKIYDMGRESRSSLRTVANVYEAQTGQRWVDLETAVTRKSSL